MLDEIVFPRAHADAAAAAARLLAVSVERSALEITVVCDGDDHLLVGDQVFDRDVADLFADLSPALVAEFLLHLAQLGDDDLVQLVVRAQDLEVARDLDLDLRQLVEDLLTLHAGQALELHLDDGLSLLLAEVEDRLLALLAAQELLVVDLDFAHQAFACVGRARRCADQADHVVQMVERFLEAQQDVLPRPRLRQQERRAPADHFTAVRDEVFQVIDQRQLARLAVDDRQHDDAGTLLQLRVLVEVVENNLRLFAAPQFEDDAHAMAVALVADVRDALDLLVVDQRGSLRDQAALVHLVRDLGDDDRVAVLADLLEVRPRPNRDVAAASLVGPQRARTTAQDAARREVRALDDLDELLELRVGVLDQLYRRVHDFVQVVWRDVGRHADGDARGSVDQ